MDTLLKEINSLRCGFIGTPLTDADIDLFQKELSESGFNTLPEIVITFLKHYNGFLLENRCFWGINTNEHYTNDILGENAIAQNPQPNDLLLLGSTETTYIGWFKSTNNYSMIDKNDFMVLHNFNNFQNAVRYILKIDD